MSMIPTLHVAFEKASALPEADQKFLAALLLEEMAEEKKWQDSFARSQDVLTRMAEDAIAEDERGETLDLDEIL
jgi:hypothetical protein